MAVKSTAKPVAETTTPWENPLIPNKKLRELYTAMVEIRLLEEYLAKSRKKSSAQLLRHRREEGCLVSTVLSLKPGDLTSESRRGIAIEFLHGAKVSGLIQGTAGPRSSRELPEVEETSARLHVAIGAAVALAAKKKGLVVVAYVHAGDLSAQDWRPVLRLAAKEAAPIFFVVLPSADGTQQTPKAGQLSHIATACGVPGIPVDAADPVALYRVTQESMLRSRAGGGPVLMECIPFQIPGQRAQPADAILTMQQFMLPRKVANEAWFEGVSRHFADRLKAAAK